MPEFVVFLRAVNVGKRKLTMAQAREALSDSGFADVESHIQTGNFLLGTSMRSAAMRRSRLFSIAVAIRFCSRGSGKNSRQPMVVASPAFSLACVGYAAATGASGRW